MNIEKKLKTLIVKKPLKLDCGKTINNFPIAYETYGSLNEKKDNAILVFHALTGDQFVTGLNPVTKKDGWWSYAIGKLLIVFPQSSLSGFLTTRVFSFVSIFIKSTNI